MVRAQPSADVAWRALDAISYWARYAGSHIFEFFLVIQPVIGIGCTLVLPCTPRSSAAGTRSAQTAHRCCGTGKPRPIRMIPRMTIQEPGAYSGTDVLEVMTEARNYNRYLTALIDAQLRPGIKVLDFGAGAGTFAVPLVRRGVDLVCVEPDAALGARLRNAGAKVIAE